MSRSARIPGLDRILRHLPLQELPALLGLGLLLLGALLAVGGASFPGVELLVALALAGALVAGSRGIFAARSPTFALITAVLAALSLGLHLGLWSGFLR